MKPIKFIFITLLGLLSISCSTQKKLKDSDLIKKYDASLDDFGEFIWYRDKDSTIIINKKNLKKIYKNTKSSNSNYFSFLYNYNSRLTTKKHRAGKSLKFSERAFIAGHIVDCLYKCQNNMKNSDSFKNSKFINSFLSPWDRNKYNEEFKKHNYYGLELLKKHHLKHYKYFPDIDTIPYKEQIIIN